MNEKLRVEDTTALFFGLCPNCKRDMEWWDQLNVGRENWGVCYKCEVKWLVGKNITGDWRYETIIEWRRNYQVLCSLKEVEFWLP